MPASARTTIPPSSSRCATKPMRSPKRERLRAGCTRTAAFRRAGRRQGQYRRRGPADHRGLPGLRLSRRRATRPSVARLRRPARSSSARPISTSSRPALSACARPTAFRAIRSTPRLDPGRIELRLGGRGRCRPCAARARHRHGGLRPRAGHAQQYRRPEAEPRPGLDGRRRAGLPHARLRVGLCAHRR